MKVDTLEKKNGLTRILSEFGADSNKEIVIKRGESTKEKYREVSDKEEREAESEEEISITN